MPKRQYKTTRTGRIVRPPQLLSENNTPDHPDDAPQQDAAESVTDPPNANPFNLIMDQLKSMQGQIDSFTSQTSNDSKLHDLGPTKATRTSVNRESRPSKRTRRKSSSSEDSCSPPPDRTKTSHRKLRKLQTEGESPLSDSDRDDNTDSDSILETTPDPAFGAMIGDSVQPSTRKKILANNFVELSDLLPRYSFNHPDEFILKQKDSSSGATFVRNKKKTLLPFNLWCEAFDIYSAVYVERAISTSQAIFISKGLLTYKRNISNLKKIGHDWQSYDRHFRRDMAT